MPDKELQISEVAGTAFDFCVFRAKGNHALENYALYPDDNILISIPGVVPIGISQVDGILTLEATDINGQKIAIPLTKITRGVATPQHMEVA